MNSSKPQDDHNNNDENNNNNDNEQLKQQEQKQQEEIQLQQWRSITRLPWKSKFMQQCSLVSPYTWWRVAELKQIHDFIPTMKTCAIALLVPIMGYYSVVEWFIPLLLSNTNTNTTNTTTTTAATTSRDTTTTTTTTTRQFVSSWWRQQLQLLLPNFSFWTTTTTTTASFYDYYICSPYSMAWMYKGLCKWMEVQRGLLSFYNFQSSADPPAYQCLAERIIAQTAYRTRQYDVYLPTPPPPATTTTTDIQKNDNNNNNNNKKPAILFLPGAGVDHMAYANTASLLANAGYVVVVVSMEPLRLADGYLSGSNLATLRHIQTTIEHKHADQMMIHHHHLNINTTTTITNTDTGIATTTTTTTSSNNIPSNWILMGHSMGSLCATKLVESLGISQLVMWASAPFLNAMGDLSSSSSSSIQVQVIQASQDAVMDAFATPDLMDAFWKRLPSQAKERCYTIQGGTHSGFAHYTSAWKPENSTLLLSREQQQQEAVQVTLNFLQEQYQKEQESTKSEAVVMLI